MKLKVVHTFLDIGISKMNDLTDLGAVTFSQ